MLQRQKSVSAPGAKTKKVSAAKKPVVEKTVADETVVQTAPEVLPAPDKASSDEGTFETLGLDPKLLAALGKLGFVTPTPIQRQSIPVGIKGEDIIGIAQTGTGKTLAFGLPILHQFIKNGNRSRGRALIILPTRELALQVNESLSQVGKPFGLRTSILIGGAPMRPQLSELRNNPDIIVATPGRLIDHLQQRNVDLRTVDTLVLDEADRMLDMGFAPQIKQILREVPSERHTMLFSATMPDAIVQIANNYMRTPTRIEVARAGTTAEDVTQELFIVPQDEKNDLLGRLLYDYTGTILVFTRTRSRASRVARYIRGGDHSVAEIHSDRSLPQRRAALDGFKAGRFRILVATDIAARGIVVSDIECVINYDLPDNAEDYVHRIGRTGRAGKSGHAISFAAPDQSALMRDIERLIESPVERSEHSLYEFEAGTSSRSKRGGSGGGSRGAGRTGSTPRPARVGARSSGVVRKPSGGGSNFSRNASSSPRHRPSSR
jgi:ATP-dependent RNA helicase RhlE